MLLFNKEEVFKKLSPELKLISSGVWFSWKNAFRYRKKVDSRKSKIFLECKNQYLNEENEHRNHKIPVSILWQKVLDSIKSTILDFKDPYQAMRFGQTKAKFDHRSNIASCIHDLPLQAAHLRVEFPQFSSMVSNASDSEFSCPETMVKYKGKLISNMLYFHLRYVLQSLSNIEKPNHICEIGGGYGGQARLWFTNTAFNPMSYVIIDFPEALFFANLFLKTSLPNTQVVYVDKTTVLDQLPLNSIILCPVHLLEKLNHLQFDLVVNTGSLQEMTEDAVDFWMDWIEKSKARFFYSLNYFAQPLDHLAEGSSLWSARLSNNWAYRVNKANPYFIKCQTTRNFGEILAERQSSPIIFEPKEALERFKHVASRSFDEQVFMDLIDLVRLSRDSDLTWMVLNETLKKMRYIPKESLYLSGLLMRCPPKNVSLSEVEKVHQQLQNIHSKSITNYD